MKNLTSTGYSDTELETFYLGDSLTTSKILIPIEILETIDENYNFTNCHFDIICK
jgi:hypothetical protein